MSSQAEWVERIARYPSRYLSAERLDLPGDCRDPAVLRVLDEMLLQGLDLPPMPQCWPDDQMTLLWLQHWLLLPEVARLLGAYRLWPALVRDATTRDLAPALRAFASCALGPRHGFDALPTLALKPRLEAVGLNALLAWQAQVPGALLARLELQFSIEVVAGQAQLPAAQPDKDLLLMAMQHARFIAA
ncbi:protein OrgA [Pseudomonas sp. BJa5]|uniref:protein OrgA n=1 Tax=Pseudomonas sp. BJa5 TaxID=2936270 RepID=UPI0025598622|nr:protein OrgA [Pseudomonas sp. BGr12]MDL2421188.1 protein OrgA [Pseudomonas sp. BGr12]